MKIGEKEVDAEEVVRAMCSVGLIQFDENQPNFVFSVWGFGRWQHDENLLQAILKTGRDGFVEVESSGD